MPKTNHPRISRTEWEHHKETIQRLYLFEDKSLMGEGGVIEIMKGKGFSASKPQYETQFMRWGFKKKLTRETWHTIGHIIKNRDKAERVSHVYAYGTRLPSDKVKKETARYKTCGENGECCTKQLLPAGIEVRPDDEEVEETILSLEVQGTHLSNTLTIWPPVEPYDLESSWNLAPVLGSFQLSDHQILNNTLLADLPTPIPIDDLFQNAKIWGTESSISYSQPGPFNRCDDVVGHSSLGIPRLGIAFFIPMSTMCLFSNLNIPLFHEFQALLKENQPNIFALIKQTRHLLPSEPNQLQKASVDLVILKQILYLLMNNFAGSDYAVFDTIFEQVRQFPVAHMESMLEALPHPYTAALQQSILTIAIKSNIPTLVEVMLRKGLDINLVTCIFDHGTFTPLGLACKFRRLEVVKTLLRAGAEPNRIWRGDFRDRPVAQLFGRRVEHEEEASYPPVVSSILQQLLDYHVRVSWFCLLDRRFWKSEILVDVLIHHNTLPLYQESLYPEFGMKNVFGMIMEFVQQEKILLVIQSILGNDPVLPKQNLVGEKLMVKLLENASYKGNLSLIGFLLERIGLTPNSECLFEAIHGNQLLLVTKYIEMGVKIDEVSRYLRSQERFVKPLSSDVDSYLLEGYSLAMDSTTPFAEALRSGNQEMIDLLTSLGGLETAIEREQFESAIAAAAETGNQNLIQHLLEMDRRRFCDTSELSFAKIHKSTWKLSRNCGSALTAAVLGGYKDIVELLMAAGVQPGGACVAAAILTRNVQLFDLFLDTAVCINDRPGLAILAVRWGSQHVLKRLIVCGADPNESEMDLQHLKLRLLNPETRKVYLSTLNEAMERGDHEMFQLLLDNGVYCNAICSDTATSPLEEAINCGHETFAYKLLTYGTDPRDPGALQAAMRKSHELAVAILKSSRERYPHDSGEFAIPALLEAIDQQNETMVGMLASHIALNRVAFREAVTGNLMPLGKGIATGNVKIVQILLKCGSDPNGTVEVAERYDPRRGRSNAVLKAIWTGSLAMVELLHKSGADLGFSATIGIVHTSLQLAIDLGHFEIVQYLLEQGVDVNAPPCIWEGGNALQFAAKTGSVRIAEMLLERGAEINHPGSKYMGKSAFEFAAEHGRIDMLLWLFHHGVDIVSDGGEQVCRACEFAEVNGQVAAKELVEQLGMEAQQNVASTSYETFW